MRRPDGRSDAPYRPQHLRQTAVDRFQPEQPQGPWTAASLAAEVTGVGRPEKERAPGVEANARLTGTTGLLLLVMLAAEGLTIASIRPLLPWHIAIGLALLPPVGLKLASTTWRFASYYLGDARYRQAGPPHPVLRALGPFVVLTTVAVLASGVALWLAGPQHQFLLTLHQGSFILWFAAMTIHVLAHAVRAVRLARADLDPGARQFRRIRAAGVRQSLVLGSLVAGIVLALATRGMVSSWSSFIHYVR